MTVHLEKASERKVSRGFRVPESVLLLLEAVQKRDGDLTLNETAQKAFEAYVEQKLAA
jgi:hypothetical protein